MLVHEIVKGLFELISLQGFKGSKEQNQQVADKVDILKNEPYDLKYGKFIYDALRNVAINNNAEPRTIPYFFAEVYKMDDEEFIEFVENSILDKLTSEQQRWAKITIREIEDDLKADSTGLDEIKVQKPGLNFPYRVDSQQAWDKIWPTLKEKGYELVGGLKLNKKRYIEALNAYEQLGQPVEYNILYVSRYRNREDVFRKYPQLIDFYKEKPSHSEPILDLDEVKIGNPINLYNILTSSKNLKNTLYKIAYEYTMYGDVKGYVETLSEEHNLEYDYVFQVIEDITNKYRSEIEDLEDQIYDEENLEDEEDLDEVKIQNPNSTPDEYQQAKMKIHPKVIQAWIDYYTEKIDNEQLIKIIKSICRNFHELFYDWISDFPPLDKNDGSSSPTSSGSLLNGFYDSDYISDDEDIDEDLSEKITDMYEKTYRYIISKIKPIY
jgi:hypothetical protein